MTEDVKLADQICGKIVSLSVHLGTHSRWQIPFAARVAHQADLREDTDNTSVAQCLCVGVHFSNPDLPRSRLGHTQHTLSYIDLPLPMTL